MAGLRIALYHNLHSGGAKRTVVEQIRGLAKHHTVALFSLESADHSFAEAEDGASIPVTLFEYRRLPRWRSPFGRLNPLSRLGEVFLLNRLSRQIAAEIDQQGFDVVLVHPCQVTQTPLLIDWLKTPTLYFCQELPRRLYEPPIPRPYQIRSRLRRILDRIDPLPPITNKVMRDLDRGSARQATRIIANSHFTAANATAAYQREIEVCNLGVDTHSFQPTTQKRERYVLSVGALTPAKGFDFVINALATLPRPERPPLVIISNYQEVEELRYLMSLAEEKKVSLQCHARVSESELQNWYSRAGCVAYAPVREPLGLIALEAMAVGVPLVGVDEGGVKETIVHNTTGLLAPREPEAFGKAIQQLLDQPVYAENLGRAARNHILAQWTWEHHIKQLETFLYETAAHSSKQPAQ